MTLPTWLRRKRWTWIRLIACNLTNLSRKWRSIFNLRVQRATLLKLKLISSEKHQCGVMMNARLPRLNKRKLMMPKRLLLRKKRPRKHQQRRPLRTQMNLQKRVKKRKETKKRRMRRVTMMKKLLKSPRMKKRKKLIFSRSQEIKWHPHKEDLSGLRKIDCHNTYKTS